ncbi:MAG: GNAT family N-acetyltransferase [Chitinophagaceae bacterium]
MTPIYTERLTIRNFHSKDWMDLFEYRSTPEICRFQGYEPYSAERCQQFAEAQSQTEFGEPGKWAQLAIELTSEKKLIADIGLKPEYFDTRLVEFGISLSHLYQRSGYAQEALNAVLDYLFTQHHVHRVTGITDQENESCIRLLEQVGFRKEGTTRQSFWNNNMWRDEYLFAMLKNDFS